MAIGNITAERPLESGNARSSVRDAGARETLGLVAAAAPAVILVGLALVLPLGWLAALSFLSKDGGLTLGNYASVLTDVSYAKSFWLTVWISGLVTAICAVAGYIVAYAITLMSGPVAAVALALVALPFWTSVLVRTYSWLILLQNKGLVNNLLIKFGAIAAPIPMMHNITGTVIGMVHIMLPFMVFPLYAGLRRIDSDYMRAAVGLGASASYAFWRIYFPLSLPGLIAGIVLVFVASLGFYITPALLGGGKVIMMALVFERDINWSPNWGLATAAAVLFAGALLVLFAVVARVLSLERLFVR